MNDSHLVECGGRGVWWMAVWSCNEDSSTTRSLPGSPDQYSWPGSLHTPNKQVCYNMFMLYTLAEGRVLLEARLLSFRRQQNGGGGTHTH